MKFLRWLYDWFMVTESDNDWWVESLEQNERQELVERGEYEKVLNGGVVKVKQSGGIYSWLNWFNEREKSWEENKHKYDELRDNIRTYRYNKDDPEEKEVHTALVEGGFAEMYSKKSEWSGNFLKPHHKPYRRISDLSEESYETYSPG